MTTQDPAPSSELFLEPIVEGYLAQPHFVRRDWLAAQVDESLADPNCRFVLLTAAPGAGKSTFMAQLAHDHPDWLRYFIRRDSKTPLSSGDARSFLFAIGHQLACRRPDLFRPENLEVYVRQEIEELQAGGRAVAIQVEDLQVSPFYQTALKVEQRVWLVAGDLVGLSVKHLTLQTRLGQPGNLQYLALLDPAKALLAQSRAERIVVLVDALDELRYLPAGETLLDWLADCPTLPENVRLVLTSRPDQALLSEFRQRQEPWLRELAIKPEADQVENDLRQCAERFVAQARVRQTLADASLPPQPFVETAVAKARGNFQCLTALFRNLEHALAQGSQAEIRRALTLAELPDSLQELYACYLRQVQRTVGELSVEAHGARPLEVLYLPAWEGLYQPLLGTLSIAREALDQDQLRALGGLGVETRWVAGAMSRLVQFLDRHGAGFRLYHASLIEFLTGGETWTAYPDCYLDPREWHRKVVAHYLGSYEQDWTQCDNYGLNHLVDHVVGAGLSGQAQTAVLDRLLTDAFVEAILERAGWLLSFVEDMAVLARIDPDRAGRLALDLILTRSPNSLVIQRALRLLVKLRPTVGPVAGLDEPRQQAVDRVVEILSTSAADAPGLLVAQLEHETDPRVRGLIALALAETGDIKITGRLLALLRQERREVSWAAADALIALNDRTVVGELVRWYEAVQGKNDPKHAADKERIIYILGWMHAEEAQALKRSAWAAPRSKIIGRAVDLTWLLQPAEGDVAYLLEQLQHLLTSQPERPDTLGPWADEWLQKRLVRALQRLGVTTALPDLRRLQAHVGERPAPPPPGPKTRRAAPKQAQRDRLVEALADAIADLEARG